METESDLNEIVLNFFSDASKGLFGTAKIVEKLKLNTHNIQENK